jgi:hypothetical protein
MRLHFSTAASRLSRLWFALKNLAVRLRFMTGKASFVEADVQLTTNAVIEAEKEAARQLVAHYQLVTRKPRTGDQGWRLFEERVGAGVRHRTAVLQCGYCGHLFVVQVLSSIDPLASDMTGGRPPAKPASYSSDWFKFMHEDFAGQSSLYCAHCEQKSAPSVDFLVAP